MTTDDPVGTIVVMGVSGSGKSTVGYALAAHLRWEFLDADSLHPAANVDRMAAGIPLTDEQRLPWLRAVGERLADGHAQGRGIVTACSALRRAYRDLLRTYVPDALFAQLDGSEELFRGRLLARRHEFMPPSLLDSQLATLEPLSADERGVLVDASRTPDQIVGDVARALRG